MNFYAQQMEGYRQFGFACTDKNCNLDIGWWRDDHYVYGKVLECECGKLICNEKEMQLALLKKYGKDNIPKGIYMEAMGLHISECDPDWDFKFYQWSR